MYFCLCFYIVYLSYTYLYLCQWYLFIDTQLCDSSVQCILYLMQITICTLNYMIKDMILIFISYFHLIFLFWTAIYHHLKLTIKASMYLEEDIVIFFPLCSYISSLFWDMCHYFSHSWVLRAKISIFKSSWRWIYSFNKYLGFFSFGSENITLIMKWIICYFHWEITLLK